MAADDHLAFRVDAVHLKYRLGNVDTNGCERLHDWLLRIVGALTAPTSVARVCRWRSRPQQKPTLECSAEIKYEGATLAPRTLRLVR